MKLSKSIMVLALSGAAVSPAFADVDVNITAEVASVCEFSASSGGADPSAPIVLAVAQNGTHTGVTQAGAATTRTMRLACNQPFVVHLESEQGAVRRQSEANGGTGIDTPVLGGLMAKAIGYTATPNLAGLDTALFTPSYTSLVADQDLMLGTAPADKIKALNVVRTDANGQNSGGAYDGTLEIGISTETTPTLVAGSYRDTLKVILIAQ